MRVVSVPTKTRLHRFYHVFPVMSRDAQPIISVLLGFLIFLFHFVVVGVLVVAAVVVDAVFGFVVI